MTPQSQTDTSAVYTPDSQDRRRGGRPDDDKPAWWRALIRPTEIVAGAALFVGVFNSFGFHRESPTTAIIAITHTVDSLGRRADREDSTTAKLTDRLTFMNYLLCVQAKSGPTPLGAESKQRCETIIQQRLAP